VSRGGNNGNVAAPSDRTARAVAAQVRAMGCPSYEIGILNAAQGQMRLRTWTVDVLEHRKTILWLRLMNAQGRDIYVRPLGSVGLVLADDLDAAAIVRLKHEGLAPAVVVETSPGNFQAWLRVSQQPIAPEQATMVGRILVERYGGDPNSADWRHFGRLAGFTNRKPKHRRGGGMQPFVVVREAAGVAAERGAQLLEEAAQRLTTQRTQPAEHAPLPRSPAPGGPRTPGEVYAHYAAQILPRFPHPDYSKLDWMVCRDMASNDLGVDAGYLEQALREGSPYLAEQRKRGHVDDYVALTASNVMKDADVIAARARLASGDGMFQLGS
jgi:RepB DNA-primase from phage plasmid